MTSPLENLRAVGHLQAEPPDAGEQNRYIVFQAVPHTLGLGPEVWRVLARCHDIRNRGEYEGNVYADERLLADLIRACKLVAEALRNLPRL